MAFFKGISSNNYVKWMPSDEIRAPRKYRSVSDLRIQYMCEYRLHLRNIHGDLDTDWSRRGTVLHENAMNIEPTGNGLPVMKGVLLVVIILSAMISPHNPYHGCSNKLASLWGFPVCNPSLRLSLQHRHQEGYFPHPPFSRKAKLQPE